MPSDLERQHDVVKLGQREEIPLVQDRVNGVEIRWPMSRPIKSLGGPLNENRMRAPDCVRPIGPFSAR